MIVQHSPLPTSTLFDPIRLGGIVKLSVSLAQ